MRPAAVHQLLNTNVHEAVYNFPQMVSPAVQLVKMSAPLLPNADEQPTLEVLWAEADGSSGCCRRMIHAALSSTASNSGIHLMLCNKASKDLMESALASVLDDSDSGITPLPATCDPTMIAIKYLGDGQALKLDKKRVAPGAHTFATALYADATAVFAGLHALKVHNAVPVWIGVLGIDEFVSSDVTSAETGASSSSTANAVAVGGIGEAGLKRLCRLVASVKGTGALGTRHCYASFHRISYAQAALCEDLVALLEHCI